jgi:hypothetical protein
MVNSYGEDLRVWMMLVEEFQDGEVEGFRFTGVGFVWRAAV